MFSNSLRFVQREFLANIFSTGNRIFPLFMMVIRIALNALGKFGGKWYFQIKNLGAERNI